MPLKALPTLRQLNHLAPNDIGRSIFARPGFEGVADQVRDGLLSRRPKCLADGGHHRSGTRRAGVSSDVNFLLVRKAIQRE